MLSSQLNQRHLLIWLLSASWLHVIIMTIISWRDDYIHRSSVSSPGLCPISLVWLMLIHQVILLLSSQGVMGKSESESTGIKCKISLFYFPKNCNRECKMMASVVCESSARLWPLRNAELARNKQVNMVTRLSYIVNKKWTRNVAFSLLYLNVI